jgi:rhamnosyl/mannosyltransferase
VLLEAMAKTHGVELFIIGSGELEDSLARQTESLGITDKVHFLGTLETEDLKSAFYDCDIFTLPSVSRSECFGLVQLEAMVYGKPVINTSLPTAVPEVSLDGVSGITVEPANAVELADAINKLCDDEEFRKKCGQAARARCEEQYSLDIMQKRIRASYLKMLNKDSTENS